MWIRTNNGLINSAHVVEIYAHRRENQWEFVATLSQETSAMDGFTGKVMAKNRSIVLDIPELTVLMESVSDAKQARDKLIEKLNFEILD